MPSRILPTQLSAKMQLLSYCGFLCLIITSCLGVPIKSSNSCGYAVIRFQDTFSAYFDYNVDYRHAI